MKYLRLPVIFLILPIFLFGQGSDTPIMQYWVGGTLNIDFGMHFSSGGGPGAGIFGGVISPSLNNGSAAVFGNPAELALMTKPHFTFDTKIPFTLQNFGITQGSLISAQSLKESSDDFLSDTTTFVLLPSSYRKDIELNRFNFGLGGGLTSFSAGFPISKKFMLAYGFNNAIDFNMNMFLNGIRMNIITEKQIGNNITPIDMILNSSFLMEQRLRMNHMNFAIAWNMVETQGFGQLSMGLTFNRYQMTFDYSSLFYSDGMMVINNSSEYYFNNPADRQIDFAKGETNELYWKTAANFRGEDWTTNFGIYYNKPGSRWKFSLVYQGSPSFKLFDPNAYSESYQPKFMVGRVTGENDDALDIIIDSLNIAKPNLTIATSNRFSQEFELSFPSSLTLGVDFGLGAHMVALNYVSYSGEFAYSFNGYKIGKKPETGFRYGLDIKMPEEFNTWGYIMLPVRLLFLDFDGLLLQAFKKRTGYRDSHYRFGIGLMTGKGIAEGFDEEMTKDMKDLMDIPLLTGLSLSRKYTLLDNLDVGVVVFGWPDLFMKFSFGYKL